MGARECGWEKYRPRRNRRGCMNSDRGFDSLALPFPCPHIPFPLSRFVRTSQEPREPFESTCVPRFGGATVWRRIVFHSSQQRRRQAVRVTHLPTVWMRVGSHFSTAWNGGEYGPDGDTVPFQTVAHGRLPRSTRRSTFRLSNGSRRGRGTPDRLQTKLAESCTLLYGAASLRLNSRRAASMARRPLRQAS